jgi:pimeloyl-ACP methyl ester carboxylesterase
MMAALSDGIVTRRAVSAHGRTLSFLAAGAPRDPAIVLLHGVGSGSDSWREQLSDLPQHGYYVIAWDQPGYGASDPLPMDAPGAADYGAALADLADALDLHDFILLGHSLGALIAGAFAAGSGNRRVKTLVLASPTTGFATATPDILRTKVQQRIDDMMRLGPALLAERRAAALLSPAASPSAVERVRAVMAGLNRHGYVQAVKMLGCADLLADAPRLTQPTLVMSGTADAVTLEASCRRIAGALPHARYVGLPGLGHACYIEDPIAFDAALINFLDSVKP